jgi:hypothetical protein
MALGKVPKFARGGAVTGGATDIHVALRGSGSSIAGLLAGANGEVSVSTGQARISNAAVNAVGADLLASFLAHFNPLQRADPSTNLECAALKFPVTNGMLRNDTGIGVRTAELSAIGGGTINLRNEEIDIGVKPKPRSGIGVSVSSLADFIRLGGTLSKPRVTTDAKGAATAGIRVGAAVATAGLSVLAEGLFSRVSADADVCGIALGAESIRASDDGDDDTSLIESTAAKTKDLIQGAAGKVQGVFKGLFGD